MTGEVNRRDRCVLNEFHIVQMKKKSTIGDIYKEYWRATSTLSSDWNR